jgi:hypothetical protein
VTTKADILHTIRHKCLDYSCFQPGEVRECPVTTCALWPYRFGRDPDPNRTRGFAKSCAYTGYLEHVGVPAAMQDDRRPPPPPLAAERRSATVVA